jgi:type II secretory pathway component PulF
MHVEAEEGGIAVRYRESEEVRPEPEYRYLSGWPFLTVGFGTEKDYFVENLSLLVQSGMGITASLESIKKGAKNKRLKKLYS